MLLKAVIIGCLLMFAYGGAIIAAAKRDIARAPRADMFVCPTHGPMPVGATMTLMDGDVDQVVDGRTVRGPLRVCPMCFEGAIAKAAKR